MPGPGVGNFNTGYHVVFGNDALALRTAEKTVELENLSFLLLAAIHLSLPPSAQGALYGTNNYLKSIDFTDESQIVAAYHLFFGKVTGEIKYPTNFAELLRLPQQKLAIAKALDQVFQGMLLMQPTQLTVPRLNEAQAFLQAGGFTSEKKLFLQAFTSQLRQFCTRDSAGELRSVFNQVAKYLTSHQYQLNQQWGYLQESVILPSDFFYNIAEGLTARSCFNKKRFGLINFICSVVSCVIAFMLIAIREVYRDLFLQQISQGSGPLFYGFMALLLWLMFSIIFWACSLKKRISNTVLSDVYLEEQPLLPPRHVSVKVDSLSLETETESPKVERKARKHVTFSDTNQERVF